MPEEDGGAEDEGDNDRDDADRPDIPKDEGDEEGEARVSREEEVATEIENTEEVVRIECGLRGKRREVCEGNENGTDEDEECRGLEGEGDAFGFEEEYEKHKKSKEKCAFIDNEIDIPDTSVREDDVFNRIAGVRGGVD